MTTVRPKLEQQALQPCRGNAIVDIILKLEILRVMHNWIRADMTNQ